MKKMTATICLTIAVLLGSVGNSESADFQRSLSAHDRGDYATALREWKPLAEQGHATAQYNNLGLMYAEGQGVPKNNETAVKWYRLAAEQGDAAAQHEMKRIATNIRLNEGDYLPCDGLVKKIQSEWNNIIQKASCKNGKFPDEWVKHERTINKFGTTKNQNSYIRQFPLLRGGNKLGTLPSGTKILLKTQIETVAEADSSPWYRHWYSFSYKGNTAYIWKDSIDFSSIEKNKSDDYFISLNSGRDDFKIGDNVFFNSCSHLGGNKKNKQLNINNKIVEVPNIIIKEKDKGKNYFTVFSTSEVNLINNISVTARLKNFDKLSITRENGQLLYDRNVSGFTSIYELKHNGKTLGWGVGWHSHCKEYYDDVDFTVMRIIIPVIDSENNVKIDVRLFPVVNSKFSDLTKKSSGLVIVKGGDIYSGGANSCYYCLPSFYLIDNKRGITELSDPISLRDAGVDLRKMDPVIYVSWLSRHGKVDLLRNFIRENYEKIIRESDTYKAYIGAPKEVLRPDKKSCLKFLKQKSLSTEEIGRNCFPELEDLSYFYN